MHRKPVFALAGVFLAVALVVPIVILIVQADQDLDNFIIVQNPRGTQTNGNITVVTPQEIQEYHLTNLIIIGVVEAVFVTLFIVTIYFGIKHTHPEH